MTTSSYACPCGRQLNPEHVEAVLPGGAMTFGRSVVVAYRCECEPGHEKTRRYYAVSEAIDRLTEGQGLPWRNPCPLVPVPADHPDVKVWRAFINKYGYDAKVFVTELNRYA